MASEENRAQAIFEESVDLSTGDRTAFIDEACGEDETLKQAVLTLLKYASDDDDDIAAGTDWAKIPDKLIGSTIGNYTLRSVLGEGGFGVVYLADQTAPVKRRVAVKVIKLGMDTKAVIARFEAERQALALMDHANIARIFDGGTTDSGRPYFVMEYVKGVSITEFCDSQRLDLNDRISLFRDTCAAIQHAHTKGVIHRDIKPNNILVTFVDGHPVVRVIDFGIAKAMDRQLTEQTLFTESGQFIGTPEYMSPEQSQMSALDIDTRSDIYSLGVLLYELLTGQLPFDTKTLRAAGLAEIQRIIREDTPPTPSARLSSLSGTSSEASAAIGQARQIESRSLPRLLRGDLDWIVMRCLEKERGRRYETASALGADLGRYLADEPVEAGPPSARYRFKKFAKRKAGLLVAVAAIVISILAGAVFSTYYAIEAATRAREANAATLAATKSRDAALIAKEAADEREREATRLNTRLMTMKDFAKYGIINAFMEKDLAGLDRRLIKIWLDNAAEVAGADQFRTGTVGEADLLTFVGTLYRLFGFYEEARPLLQSALEIRIRARGSEHIESVWQTALLAEVLDLTGDKAGAHELGITVAERFSDLLSSDQDEALETAVFGVMRRMQEASPALFDLYLPSALAAVSSQLGTSHVTYGELVWRRGIRSEGLNHLDEAIRDYQSALEIYTAGLGSEHRYTLELQFFLARASELAGRTSVAKRHFEICYRGLFRIWGPTHWTTVRVGRDLAALLTGLGQFDEAEPSLLEPFIACREELGLNHELTQRMAEGLAGLYEAWDRPTEATRYRSMLVVPDQSAAPTGGGPIGSAGLQYEEAMLPGPTVEEPTDE